MLLKILAKTGFLLFLATCAIGQSSSALTCNPIKGTVRFTETFYTPDEPEGLPEPISKNDIPKEFPKHFDEARGKCVSKLYGPCLSSDDCPLNAGCSWHWSRTTKTFDGDTIGCDASGWCKVWMPPNSTELQADHNANFQKLIAGPNPWFGDCVCMSPEYTRAYHMENCEKLPQYGEVCPTSNVWNDTCPGEYMSCQNNRCACSPTVRGDPSVYDKKTGLCLLPLGTICTSESCQENAECSSGRCTCVAGFTEFNGTCLNGHGQSCKGSDTCLRNKFLKCIDGTCQCDGAAVGLRTYDDYNKVCRSSVGARCSVDGVAFPYCRSKLKCVGGFCQRPFLDPATLPPKPTPLYSKGIEEQCYSKECDNKIGLACIDGKCQCSADELVVQKGKCVAVLGTQCGSIDGKPSVTCAEGWACKKHDLHGWLCT